MTARLEAEPDALREAAERVLDWADHHQPWNPAGDFDALYEATGRRHPEGEEPIGPRYYRLGGPTTPDGCSHPAGAMTSTVDHDLIVCTRCGKRWANALDHALSTDDERAYRDAQRERGNAAARRVAARLAEEVSR